ncbi:DUF1700 domain-containing protein [Massilia sp. S19_KUP03_FR1]|uniref:DUF1700 domain-containing protein n=1 Tax=Massilia sp. S19_KUP03_FR1 TaxID=3025503 RepID=UPI002FCDAE61
MGKTDFLDALKRAMPGLPPALQARTLAYYEQRFVDGVALGLSEQDIARELDEPSRIAMTLRASAHEAAIARPAPLAPGLNRPAGVLRTLLSALGLGIFNLFMVAPAAVVGALLLCVYLGAMTLYVSGIAITASGLAGANELVLRAPLRAFGIDDANRTRISITETGIQVGQEKTPEVAGEVDTPDSDPAATPRVVRGAEAVAGRGLHISTDLDESSRTTQALLGLAMVMGGIILFLLGLVATRYTLLGLQRYLQMNLSLLRGH